MLSCTEFLINFRENSVNCGENLKKYAGNFRKMLEINERTNERTP